MNSQQLIERQAGLIEAELRKILGPGDDYALVDFPNHPNVGDSAIWLGEIALLRKVTGKGPRYVCEYANFSEEHLRKFHPDGPILIHGGGNFGDIWPAHHELRCNLLSIFPDRLIVQLPQTVSFSDEGKADQTAELIKKHGQFRMYVRDKVSASYASEKFGCPVALLPDSAFGIGPVKPPVQATFDAFMLIRDDAEKAGYDMQPLNALMNASCDDWLVEPENFVMQCQIKTAVRNWGRRGGRMESGRAQLYEYLAGGRVDRGLRMLSSGRVVITDRLHAHILSILLDRPNVVMDNNYGKIFNYIDAWTAECDNLWMAGNAADAARIYVDVIRRVS